MHLVGRAGLTEGVFPDDRVDFAQPGELVDQPHPEGMQPHALTISLGQLHPTGFDAAIGALNGPTKSGSNVQRQDNAVRHRQAATLPEDSRGSSSSLAAFGVTPGRSQARALPSFWSAHPRWMCFLAPSVWPSQTSVIDLPASPPS
ncbi:hypothetical protein D3C72_1819140 [compost metagenome]